MKKETKEIRQEVNCSELVAKKQNKPDNMDYALFAKDLEILINKKSLENGSDTPDYILADYLTYCLKTFDRITRRRENKKLTSDYIVTDISSFLTECLKNLDNATRRREKHYGRK